LTVSWGCGVVGVVAAQSVAVVSRSGRERSRFIPDMGASHVVI